MELLALEPSKSRLCLAAVPGDLETGHDKLSEMNPSNSSRGVSNSEIDNVLANHNADPNRLEIMQPINDLEGDMSNSEIDNALAYADPTRLLIMPAINGLGGRHSASLNPAAVQAVDLVRAPLEPTSLADQLLISTQEARNSGIILAPCLYTTPESDQTEEEDYGDSDDEE